MCFDGEGDRIEALGRTLFFNEGDGVETLGCALSFDGERDRAEALSRTLCPDGGDGVGDCRVSGECLASAGPNKWGRFCDFEGVVGLFSSSSLL